jgi:ABC-type xylose transport system permease subunit
VERCGSVGVSILGVLGLLLWILDKKVTDQVYSILMMIYAPVVMVTAFLGIMQMFFIERYEQVKPD